MNFLKKLANLFSAPSTGIYYDLDVQCRRCGEIIHTRVNLNNDLSLEYDESGKAAYHVRKVLMGSGRCFQQVEVLLTFTPERKLIDRQATGGEFLDAGG